MHKSKQLTNSSGHCIVGCGALLAMGHATRLAHSTLGLYVLERMYMYIQRALSTKVYYMYLSVGQQIIQLKCNIIPLCSIKNLHAGPLSSNHSLH